MTMIISSYTSIHPFLGAYIIHSVYDKPITHQTLLHNNIQTYILGPKHFICRFNWIHARTSNIFIQFTNISFGWGELSIHIILKIDLKRFK